MESIFFFSDAARLKRASPRTARCGLFSMAARRRRSPAGQGPW
jgi:hypothetical protein